MDVTDLMDMPTTYNRPAAQGGKLIWGPTEASSLAYHSLCAAQGPAHDVSMSFDLQNCDPKCQYLLEVKCLIQVQRVIPGAATNTGGCTGGMEKELAFNHAGQLGRLISSNGGKILSSISRAASAIGGAASALPLPGMVKGAASIVSMIGGALPMVARVLGGGGLTSVLGGFGRSSLTGGFGHLMSDVD